MTNSTGCYFYTFYRKSFFLQTVYAEQPFLSQEMISMKPWNMKAVSIEYREFPRQSPAGEYTPVQSPSPYSHNQKRYYTCSLGTEVWYDNTLILQAYKVIFFFLSPFYSSSIQFYFFCTSPGFWSRLLLTKRYRGKIFKHSFQKWRRLQFLKATCICQQGFKILLFKKPRWSDSIAVGSTCLYRYT